MFFLYINELRSPALVADRPAFIVTIKPLGIMWVMVQNAGRQQKLFIIERKCGVLIQFHEMEKKHVHFKIEKPVSILPSMLMRLYVKITFLLVY